MQFAPTNNPNDTSDQTVGNIDFFPAIAVADFRRDTRVQDTVTDYRVMLAIRSAMIKTNKELATWQATQVTAGHATLAAVPADKYDDISRLVHLYTNAIYAKAKAIIIAKYRDTDSTRAGDDRADEIENTEDDYHGEHREAVRAILGVSRATVELL